MKTDAAVKRHALPVLALLLALLPVLCSCAAHMQHLDAAAQQGAILFAYSAYRRGDYVNSLRNIHQAEAKGKIPDQQQADVSILKGRCLEGMGDRAEAASLYEYLIKTYPDSECAIRAKGRLEELRQAAATTAPSPGPTSRRDP
jgi:tetratricopeptide (TPR) repeat protein